ncbi:MAG: chloride channel protein [Chromatiaceae bacterium]|jgi:H+/Cl- antiporter ClcA|nr:chloride channel protein [Chromatiaceae bacterium]
MPRRRLASPLPYIQELLERLRLRISRPDALIELALLGLIAGLLAGLTIIALRLLVAWGQVNLLPMAAPEQFETLSPLWRAGAPVVGGVLIGVLFWFTAPSSHNVGVGHVLERLAYHQGRLPWANAAVQFVGGAISMIAGHSVGREGPSAHLGAASSNLPAQALRLPYNSLRVLAACGTAAGIAASFNTPLAGAAFAMEVLLIEYTVAGFAPVLLATVSATTLTRLMLGSDFAHTMPHLDPGPPGELPYVLLVGVLIGLLAAGFNRLFAWVSARAQRFAAWLRPVLGGVLVGLCGLLAPKVLGMGDDSVHAILLGELGIGLLALLLIVKFAASAGGIALGLPGGLIGPTIFIGATAGGLLGGIGVLLGITDPQSLGMYAMIGMGAMMAGTLQAPLAALIAILELTGEPHFIFPGMLAVVAATVTAGRVGRPESIFQTLLRARGLDYRSDPVSQSLRRVGVASVMDRRVRTLPGRVSAEEADQVIATEPMWLLVRDPGRPEVLLAAVDLVRARKETAGLAELDLHEIPGTRLQTTPVDMQATLKEAEETIADSGAEALYVVSRSVPGLTRVYGVLTPEDIRRAYRPG